MWLRIPCRRLGWLHKYWIIILFLFQDDGGKKIELKPGFLMEHDHNVWFNSIRRLFFLYRLWRLQVHLDFTPLFIFELQFWRYWISCLFLLELVLHWLIITSKTSIWARAASLIANRFWAGCFNNFSSPLYQNQNLNKYEVEYSCEILTLQKGSGYKQFYAVSQFFSLWTNDSSVSLSQTPSPSSYRLKIHSCAMMDVYLYYIH